MSVLDQFIEKAAEERAAWDQYAASYLGGRVAGKEGQTDVEIATQKAAEFADALLKLRKERFS